MTDTTVIDYGKAKIKADKFIGTFSNTTVDALTALGGTLTGSTDGDLEDVAALSTSDTYSDAAVNVAITSINLQLKELQKAYNDLLAALKS